MPVKLAASILTVRLLLLLQDFSCWYPVLRGLNQLQLGPLEVDILMKGTWWNGTLVDLWARQVQSRLYASVS